MTCKPNPSFHRTGRITADGTGRTYTYNPAGQLDTISKNNLLIATYLYDYQGQRIAKITTANAPQGAQTLIYDYDQQGHLLAEASGTGTPIRTYVWRDNTPLAQIEHQPSRRIIYYETDHLNTPRVAMDEQGKIIWRWESDAFGSTLPNEDPDNDGVKTTVNLRFPGQYYDQESGLNYNYFRNYDPSMGRYISSDPIGTVLYRDMATKNLAQHGLTSPELASLLYRAQPEFNHPYNYVDGNPISYVDPLGLSKFDKTFGLPKDFWNWYHRKYKRPGDPDLEKEEAKDICEQWKKDGRPGPDNKERGSADPSLLDWLTPWWLYSGDAN